VKLQHTSDVATAYAHMSRIGPGIKPGVAVRQGQVIGFVGSTGMSTGSHVHFEILINDRFVDPMKVKLPRGRVLDGGTLAQFQKDRDSLDSVMAHAPARVAQAH
jgi:murein DD-endopeptidase MepM/ murein hydrolase activator NlpD